MNAWKWMIVVLFFCLKGLVYGQNSKKEVVEIKTQIYCDHCKKCDSCGKNIYDAIHALAGIKKVEILDAESVIRVTYNPQKVTLEEVKNAIAGAGYDADEVKAQPVAYEKLDGCCKKK